MAAQRKTSTITDATKLVEHLSSVDRSRDGWYKGIVDIDWANVRKGANSTSWISIYYTNPQGIRTPLNIRFIGERHSGIIMPNTESGVAELTARFKSADYSIAKRSGNPSLNIKKYSTKVQTEADKLTLMYDANGQPIYPSDEYLSMLHKALGFINEIFVTEVEQRLGRGLLLVAKMNEIKRDKSRQLNAQAVLDAALADDASFKHGVNDIIFANDTISTLRAIPDVSLLTKNQIIAGNAKVVRIVQEYISGTAAKNSGAALPNPIARVQIPFDKVTGAASCHIFDATKPFQTENGLRHEIAKVDGQPVNADNIHSFLLSGSIVSGMVPLNAVCLSSMGISMPAKVDVMTVQPPESRKSSTDEFYDDFDWQGAAAGPAAAVNDPPPVAAAIEDDLLDSLNIE